MCCKVQWGHDDSQEWNSKIKTCGQTFNRTIVTREKYSYQTKFKVGAKATASISSFAGIEVEEIAVSEAYAKPQKNTTGWSRYPIKLLKIRLLSK